MIQNDIDFLEETSNQDPYYFCIRLLNLKKNKKKVKKTKRNNHFKFLIEQDHYIIDQTPDIQDVFWMMRTFEISLAKEELSFYVPHIKYYNTDFQLKMYTCDHEDVQQLAVLVISTITYIQVFQQDDKRVFRQTVSLCPQYSIEYELYIEKSQILLENLLKSSQQQNSCFKNAFKKKTHQIIEVENQRVEVKKKGIQNLKLRKSLSFSHSKMSQLKKMKHEVGNRKSFLSKRDSTEHMLESHKKIVYSKKFILTQTLKVTILVLFISIMIYFITSPSKKLKKNFFQSIDLSKF